MRDVPPVRFERSSPTPPTQAAPAGTGSWTAAAQCQSCPWTYALADTRRDPASFVAAAAEAHLAGVHGILANVRVTPGARSNGPPDRQTG